MYGVLLALMLVLVKCYDNKMVKATLHMFHPFVDSALGSKPTKNRKIRFQPAFGASST